MFRGCGTALVTPFRRDFSLDEQTLRFLVKRQLKAGVDFLVPCGTTGESPTLTHIEKRRVVEITLEEACGRVPVVAGAGGYNTAEVIESAREYESLGANGILSVTPYYNKPSQEGLYQHFKTIAASISIPILLYNVPGPHRCESRACHGRAPRANRQHCRHQGSLRKHFANERDAPIRGRSFLRAIW